MFCDAKRLAFGSYRRQKIPTMEAPTTPKKTPRTGPAAGGRPRKTDAERRLKGVTVRLSTARYAELSAYAAEGGRSLAHVVRQLLSGGLPQLTPAQEGSLRQLAGLANNLNQLAKRAHQGGFGAVGEEVAWQAQRISQLLDNFAGSHD